MTYIWIYIVRNDFISSNFFKKVRTYEANINIGNIFLKFNNKKINKLD